jgi:hypothetical protein
LEHEGGEYLFGEPMLNLADLMQMDANGRGVTLCVRIPFASVGT